MTSAADKQSGGSGGWDQVREGRGTGRPGRRIERPVERQRHAIPNALGVEVPHAGANHPAADQDAAGVRDDVDVEMGVGQEPRPSLDEHAGVRQIDNVELVPSS